MGFVISNQLNPGVDWWFGKYLSFTSVWFLL